jgi:hypothetical protein
MTLPCKVSRYRVYYIVFWEEGPLLYSTKNIRGLLREVLMSKEESPDSSMQGTECKLRITLFEDTQGNLR